MPSTFDHEFRIMFLNPEIGIKIMVFQGAKNSINAPNLNILGTKHPKYVLECMLDVLYLKYLS